MTAQAQESRAGIFGPAKCRRAEMIKSISESRRQVSFTDKKLERFIADFLVGHLLKLETRSPLVQTRAAAAAGRKIINHELLFIWSHEHSRVPIKFKKLNLITWVGFQSEPDLMLSARIRVVLDEDIALWRVLLAIQRVTWRRTGRKTITRCGQHQNAANPMHFAHRILKPARLTC